jgi:hypothetical protein
MIYNHMLGLLQFVVKCALVGSKILALDSDGLGDGDLTREAISVV